MVLRAVVVGSLSRSNVPHIVGNLLEERQESVVQLAVRPERPGSHYTMEWQYLAYDKETVDWMSVGDPRSEDGLGD